MESTGYRAGFNDLVEFIERHVRILSDPLFGDLQDYSSNTTSLSRPKSQPSNRMKGNVVASTVTAMDTHKELKQPGSFKENKKELCVCCSMEHSLENCKQFKKKRHMD